MNVLRLGLVGAGLISEVAHIPAILKTGSAVLSAIIERDSPRAKGMSVKFKLDAPTFSSVHDAARRLDAVIVATPNHTHHELAIESLREGLHVLVEKPLATSTRNARCMVETAYRAGLVLRSGFCTRYWRSVQVMRGLLHAGELGPVRRFLFQYGAPGGWTPVSGYIASKEASGGGALVMNGSHYLDRMLYFFGCPAEMRYYDDAEGGLEANALAEFRFDNEFGQFRGAIRLSKTVALPAGSAVECEKATLIHRDWSEPVLSIKYHDANEGVRFRAENTHLDLATRPDMYSLQLEDFARRCLDPNHDTVTSLEDAAKGVEITEMLYKNKAPMAASLSTAGTDQRG